MVAVLFVEVTSSVIVVTSFFVSSTTFLKPANRKRGSFRNGVRSCFSSGDSAAYGEHVCGQEMI